MSYGFLLPKTLLAIWIAAVFAPVVVGVNCTVKVVVPAGATGDAGIAVTVKSAALAPSIVIPRPVKFAPPGFLMVKVRLELLPTRTFPNGWVPPSATVVRAGCSTVISGWSPKGAIASTNPVDAL